MWSWINKPNLLFTLSFVWALGVAVLCLTRSQNNVPLFFIKVIRIWKEDDIILDKAFKATVRKLVCTTCCLNAAEVITPDPRLKARCGWLVMNCTIVGWWLVGGRLDQLHLDIVLQRGRCNYNLSHIGPIWVLIPSPVYKFSPGVIRCLEGPLCGRRGPCGPVPQRSCEAPGLLTFCSPAAHRGSPVTRRGH